MGIAGQAHKILYQRISARSKFKNAFRNANLFDWSAFLTRFIKLFTQARHSLPETLTIPSFLGKGGRGDKTNKRSWERFGQNLQRFQTSIVWRKGAGG